ncbi:pseudaminic acid cytidylyltransferase [Sinorhizobium fredii]|uniref:pseudaminic acid cytidylyltransferase n=1 Tax=Rhizobium fredii TaxID=380 RepID=UPI001297FB68|nr:pseudaminic acid cytidylyltransferase [Sinorhizobium fredii]MQW93938.1 pseudaminic acid cytidylyltransferase [Sinorhizobium fredii]UTY46210.1 pseudaminic acid cytidylyltransferase [Sinorhizobium fredii]
MKDIAIIPARGGSKRIPRKNIKDFLGRPILVYAIEAAQRSGLFSHILVSTDDEEIAAIAERCGASVPFMRSRSNADDHSTLIDVLHEVVGALDSGGFDASPYLCCLLPTAALLDHKRLILARDMLVTSSTHCVFPLVRYRSPIQRALFKRDDDTVAMREPEQYRTRSQDLLPHYYDAGQFYYTTRDACIARRPLLDDGAIGLELSDLEAQDIDEPEDWALCEMKYRLRFG